MSKKITKLLDEIEEISSAKKDLIEQHKQQGINPFSKDAKPILGMGKDIASKLEEIEKLLKS